MATLYEYTYGWDSGARTIASFAQDGEFSFCVTAKKTLGSVLVDDLMTKETTGGEEINLAHTIYANTMSSLYTAEYFTIGVGDRVRLEIDLEITDETASPEDIVSWLLITMPNGGGSLSPTYTDGVYQCQFNYVADGTGLLEIVLSLNAGYVDSIVVTDIRFGDGIAGTPVDLNLGSLSAES